MISLWRNLNFFSPVSQVAQTKVAIQEESARPSGNFACCANAGALDIFLFAVSALEIFSAACICVPFVAKFFRCEFSVV